MSESPTISTWNYAAAASGIPGSATAVTAQAAPQDPNLSIRVLSLQLDCSTNTAIEFTVQDTSAVVLARIPVTTSGKNGASYRFDPPLVATKGAGLQIKCSASFTGALYANLQGDVVIR